MSNPTIRISLYELVERIDSKVDRLTEKVAELDVDLAKHKVKTSRLSLVLGAGASALVVIISLLVKGCV